MENPNINCPSCGASIDVNAIAYQQLHSKLTKEFNEKIVSEKKNLETGMENLVREKAELDRTKAELENAIAAGVDKKLASEKNRLEKLIRGQIAEEKSEELKSLQEQLDQKILETKELNRVKTEMARISREKEDLKEKLEAEYELKINEKLTEEKTRIRRETDEKNQLKLAEKELLINQLKEQLLESQRKIEQGSMQLQGEVQELAIEEYLRATFPLDTIHEIKKGARGADALQEVNSITRMNHGAIYYESKRTKDFQSSWIEKFKKDMRAKGALFGVLISDAFPKGMDRMGQIEGIWICSMDEFKSLCFVLRESVILLDNAMQAQENKGTKMEMLYQYLIGPEFKMQIEAIVEAFSQMQDDLAKERRSMESIWKQREKQLQKVLLNTISMYGSVKGVAGSSVGSIKALEMPSLESDAA